MGQFSWVWYYACPAPILERLIAAYDIVDVDVKRREDALASGTPKPPWLQAARLHLTKANAHVKERKYQVAWQEVKAADRTLLEDPADGGAAVSRAATLLREAQDLDGRRGKAMSDLLCDENGKLRSTLNEERPRIVEAAAVRDDFTNTQYFRIELRRRHLISLFFLLLGTLVTIVTLSYFGRMELFRDASITPHRSDRLVTTIVLGVLGASISVAQALLAADITAKITAQHVGAYMVWIRPMIGAATAVVAYTLLLANDHVHVFSTTVGDNFSVIAVIALVAGFSERFIVGALNKVADMQGSEIKKP